MARSRAATKDPDTTLAGSPTSVSGFVAFRNQTKSEITIEEIVVRDPDGGEILLPVEPVTVGPSRTARLAVDLEFASQTSPGAYPLEIAVAGATSKAVAHVVASRDLTLSPDILVVDNVPAAQVTTTVVVANNGNVPGYVADFGAVPLYREDAAVSTLLALAKSFPLAGPQDIEPLPEPETSIEVSTSTGRIEIAPGEIGAVELRIVVPKDLNQTTRYVAALPISMRTLLLFVVPAGAAEKPS